MCCWLTQLMEPHPMYTGLSSPLRNSMRAWDSSPPYILSPLWRRFCCRSPLIVSQPVTTISSPKSVGQSPGGGHRSGLLAQMTGDSSGHSYIALAVI